MKWEKNVVDCFFDQILGRYLLIRPDINIGYKLHQLSLMNKTEFWKKMFYKTKENQKETKICLLLVVMMIFVDKVVVINLFFSLLNTQFKKISAVEINKTL